MANRLLLLLLAPFLFGCVLPQDVPEELQPLELPENIPVDRTPVEEYTPPERNITRPDPPSSESMTMGNNTGGKLVLSDIERDLFDRVNEKRLENDLEPLVWNEELLPVARLHSLALAKENLPLTEPALFCKRPFIHHEGFDFGLYAIDRLRNWSIFYFSSTGENLFIAPTFGEALTYDSGQACPDDLDTIGAEEEELEKIRNDYLERLEFIKNATRVSWESVEWKPADEIEDQIVEGWMDSPGHRMNILHEPFDESAIGIAQVNDYLVVTQLFIEKIDCGYQDAQCCLEDQMLYCYEPWYCTDYYCQ